REPTIRAEEVSVLRSQVVRRRQLLVRSLLHWERGNDVNDKTLVRRNCLEDCDGGCLGFKTRGPRTDNHVTDLRKYLRSVRFSSATVLCGLFFFNYEKSICTRTQLPVRNLYLTFLEPPHAGTGAFSLDP